MSPEFSVSVTVNPVEDYPRTGEDYKMTGQNAPVNIHILANDSDPEGPVTLVYAPSSTPLGATITVETDADGAYLHYDPRIMGSGGFPVPGTPGMDDFTYLISDAQGQQSTGTVYVQVTDDWADDWPWAIGDNRTTLEDQSLVIDVLANDMDAEGEVWLTWAGPAGGMMGTVEVFDNPNYPNGAVRYTPPADYFGAEYFGYDIRDGAYQGTGSYGTVTILPVNDPPDAVDDEAYAGKNHEATIYPKANDNDDKDVQYGEPLVLIISDVTDPAHGVVSFTEDAITYTPDLDYSGPDPFVYTITDAHGATATATVNMTVVNVNLTIYQGGENGAAVAEALEETRGAFTVANLNDTDGDSIIDNVDQEVLQSSTGRDERDLMKLVIDKPTVDRGGSVVLDVNPANYRIRFWGNPTKGVEVPIDLYGEVWIPTSQLPKTVYVEALQASTALRDLEITATYEEIPGIIVTDTVKATGVWASVTDVRHNNADGFPVAAWPDFPTTGLIHDALAASTHFGLGYEDDVARTEFRNIIAIQFTTEPPGLRDYPNIRFDVSRQIRYKDVTKREGQADQVATEDFRVPRDEPNDDTHDDDESQDVSTENHLYVADEPSGLNVKRTANFLSFTSRNTFREFVRVRFDGTRPTGETIDGSRSSDFYPWHARHTIVKDRVDPSDPTKVIAKRDTGDAAETDTNDIEPGAIQVPLP